jgi:2-polyprenyl-6-methoxyphenol hydroxylase-like FAD-dependent oxidoreductase
MRVLVIGAGPTGLTLALALRRRGVACRLVEQAPQPLPWSRALGVQARTLEVMERLGLAGRLLAAAHRVAGLSLHGGDGGGDAAAPPLRVDLDPAVHPRFPPLVILPQSDTERLLAEAGAAPERSVTFAGLEGRGAWLRHPDGRGEFAAAEWIVGCDGAHSAVRHALKAGFAGAQYPQQALLADGRLDGGGGGGLDPARIHLFPGAGRMLAYFPMPGGLWRAIAVLPPEAPPPPDPPPAEAFAGDGVPALRDLAWSSAFRISRRQVDRVRHGHVLLAGDAAHIHSPVGGQGMNLGIQDAWALAAALPRGEAAVDAWAAERHAIARRVLFATHAATRAMAGGHGGRAQVLLRRAAFGLLAGVPWLRRRATRAVAGLDYPGPAP